MFLEEQYEGNNIKIKNVPLGIIVDRVITHKDKYDFY